MKPTLLLVEDCNDLRQLLFVELDEHFDFLVASTFDRASSIIAGFSRVDALVTDLDFKDPKKRDGLDIAAAFRLRHAKAPVVLMTGQILSDANRSHLEVDLGGMLLSKPFSLADLRQVLDKHLGLLNRKKDFGISNR